MTFETVKKSNTPLKIVEQILHHLESGTLVPGDKLPGERELCVEFGVGRSSVREAIRILVVMGYLESKHGKGTFLKALPKNEEKPDFNNSVSEAPLPDLLEALELVATGLVRMAAERAADEDINELKKILSEMTGSESVENYWAADAELYISIASAADNLALTEIMRVILAALNGYKTYFLTGFAVHKFETLQVTGEMISNLERHQPVQAVVNMRKRLSLMDYTWKETV